MHRASCLRGSLFVLAFIVVAPSSGWSQEKDPKGVRYITATGSATVRFRADRAQIFIGIRTSDPVFEAARDANTKGMKAIEEAIAALKIRDVTVSHAPINIAQTSSLNRFGGIGNPGAAPEAKPYSVTQQITISIKETNPDKLRELIDRTTKVAVDGGANTSGGAPIDPDYGFYPGRTGDNGPRIVLSREDDSEFRDKAFAEAVKKAMRAAKAIADGAGVKIIETASITEGDDTLETSSGVSIFGGGGATRTTIREVGGELELTVRVRVKCTY